MIRVGEAGEDTAPAQFSTRKLPVPRRLDAWDEALTRHCGPVLTDHGPQFDGRIDVRLVGDLSVSRLIHNARSQRRGLRQIAEGDPGVFHLILQLSGHSTIERAGGEAVKLLPGDMALLDSGRPYALGFERANAQVWLHLPRRALGQRVEGASPLLGARVTGSPAVMLGHLIRSAFGNASVWTPGQAGAIAEALINLTAEIWWADVRQDGQQEDQLVPPIVNAIQHHIVTNLHAPGLSPETIAREYGISVRHLHRLFRLTGISLARWIRRSRLDRCAADLLDHSLAAESLTRIAYRWGFEGSSQFSRAFKAEFGQSPRTFRMERQLHHRPH